MRLENRNKARVLSQSYAEYTYEKFKFTRGVNRWRKSRKGRQYNGQKKKYKRIQNITQKTKNRATRT